MARHRKKKLGRKHKHGAEVPTHALNDIMFFLLLFFLIISTLSEPEQFKVDNPVSNSSLQNSKKTVLLTVTANREYYFENLPVKEEELDAKFAEVAKKEEESKEELGVSVAIDKSLEYSDIIHIMLIAQKHRVRVYVKTTKKFT